MSNVPIEQCSLQPTSLLEIGLLVYPGFQFQDLSGLLAPFEVAASVAPDTAYRNHVVSLSGGLIRSSSGLEVLTEKIRTYPYDSLLVVGGPLSFCSSLRSAITKKLKDASLNGTRRIASVSTGSFLLAEAGLLDERIATTHWRYVAQLKRQFPKVKVTDERIFTRDNTVWTSAGVTAGIDLALALIEEDLGNKVARIIAQFLVAHYPRPGSQLQFSTMADIQPDSHRICAVLAYMRENLARPISTEQLAMIARLSPRQFGRAFLAETGETPAKAIERLRVEEARKRLEHGQEPLEVIATSSGFRDQERMRRAFIRTIGHPPQSIRRLANLYSDSSIQRTAND
jgi:transcriptional regulator GlxA family with amidase domain